MSLQNSLRLIPRYNWDYRFPDLLNALDGSIRPKQEDGFSFDEVLGGPSVFTTSGRVSLYTILRSLDLPKGAQVGVPLFCCSVVFDAIVQAGFKPRFLDIVSDTYTLSPSDVERKRKELSAVIAVHMFGHPADMDAIKAAAGPLPVIEDCAQSLLSTYKGNVAGSTGTVSFFSFRSGKYISAGEGSAIVSREPELFAAIKKEIRSFPQWRFHQSVLHSLSTYAKSAMYQRPWYGTVGFTIGRRMDREIQSYRENRVYKAASRRRRFPHHTGPAENFSEKNPAPAAKCSLLSQHNQTKGHGPSSREARLRKQLLPVRGEIDEPGPQGPAIVVPVSVGH